MPALVLKAILLNISAAVVSVYGAGLGSSAAAIPFSPGFDIHKISFLAESLPSHSWEYGTAAQALLELYNSSLTVFGSTPFPVQSASPGEVKALAYAKDKIQLGGKGANVLVDGDGAVGDPASLGVSAVMLGKTSPEYARAAKDTLGYLLNKAPRFSNGAISQRANVPELWADFMYMVPPFLAYYAADQKNETLLRESVRQCSLYRDVLQSKNGGLWGHIIGPHKDSGLWSTGNGWAAAGMARVLATVVRAPVPEDQESDAEWREEGIKNLTTWIMEILKEAIKSPLDNGLLPNYIGVGENDQKGARERAFGEISGSALLASVVYRMAVLQPQSCGDRFLDWADKLRNVLGGTDSEGVRHVTDEGVVRPAVNPLGWQDVKPYTKGSPEGQAFVVLMFSAWRDCVIQGVCPQEGVKTRRGLEKVPGRRMHRRRLRPTFHSRAVPMNGAGFARSL